MLWGCSVLNSASDRLVTSSSLISIFWALIFSFIWAIFFFVSARLLFSKRWNLRYSPWQGNPLSLCSGAYVGEGSKREQCPCSALSRLSVTSPTTHNQIGHFWCWVPGGWVCVHSRTLWVSPKNCLVRLGVSPTAASTPTGVFSQRFWGFIFPHWNPGLCGLSCSPVVPASLSAWECGTTQSTSRCLACSTSRHLACPGPLATALLWVLSAWLPISAPPTSLDECMFFNSLVVGLPYSSIFCHFWLFFIFKFVVVLVLVLRGGTVCLPTSPSWREVPSSLYCNFPLTHYLSPDTISVIDR